MSMTLSLRARYALVRNDDGLDFEFMMKGNVFYAWFRNGDYLDFEFMI